MGGPGKDIADVFERREREFLLAPIRVVVKSSMEELEVGDMTIPKMKTGETMEMARWVAEEMAEMGIVEIQEEAFEIEIFKALTREKMLGASQVSALPSNFYLMMRRRLSAVKTGADSGKYRREDYEKLRANCYDLIGRRLSKLLSVSSSASLQTMADKLTPEEREFFSVSREHAEQWKHSLLGEP